MVCGIDPRRDPISVNDARYILAYLPSPNSPPNLATLCGSEPILGSVLEPTLFDNQWIGRDHVA
jgi:hypothetical protein